MTVTNDGTTLSTFTYDSNGNQTVKNVGGSLTTYTYSYENKMTGITYPDSSLNTFTYDGDGKRLQKQDSSGTLRLVYDPQGPTGLYDLAKETDGDNALVAFYTQGPMLISQRRGGNTYWYHDDALGSTSALTASDETTTSTYKYYAFGDVLAATGTLTNPFKYVGGLGYYSDPDSGLMLLRARYYWPGIARFLTRDPLALLPMWHAYLYARNTPVGYVDPGGLWCLGLDLKRGMWPGPFISGFCGLNLQGCMESYEPICENCARTCLGGKVGLTCGIPRLTDIVGIIGQLKNAEQFLRYVTEFRLWVAKQVIDNLAQFAPASEASQPKCVAPGWHGTIEFCVDVCAISVGFKCCVEWDIRRDTPRFGCKSIFGCGWLKLDAVLRFGLKKCIK